MKLIELLSDRDKQLITDYIKAFAGGQDFYYNFEEKFQGIDKVLREWNNKKYEMCELLGGNLILRKDITYKMPSFELYDKYYNEIDNAAGVYYRKLKDLMVTYYRSVCVALYDSDYETYRRASQLSDFVQFTLFQPNVLVDNKYLGETRIFVLPTGEEYKVNNGMRPMKIINKMLMCIPQVDERSINKTGMSVNELFDKFRIWHSKLFNQATFSGELCLSIHPLDFMTMSDNAHKWNSCMRWHGYFGSGVGDYRTGTVECMNSAHIIVAYLHSPNTKLDSHTLDNVPEDWEWNSKRWRELFIVYPDAITEIKGYPYQDEHLTSEALAWIKQIAKDNMGWEYDDDKPINISAPIYTDDNTQICITPQTTYFMYNDFGTLNEHRGYVNREKLTGSVHDVWWKRSGYANSKDVIIDLPYDGYATCMCCGHDIDEVEENGNRLLCDACIDLHRCPYCGEYYEGDGYYVADFDEPICDSCYENDTYYDDINDETRTNGSECICLQFRYCDEKGEMQIHDRDIYTASPCYGYNEGYEDIFSEMPEYDTSTYMFYVTPDMVKDMEAVCELFHIRGALRERLLASVPAL